MGPIGRFAQSYRDDAFGQIVNPFRLKNRHFNASVEHIDGKLVREEFSADPPQGALILDRANEAKGGAVNVGNPIRCSRFTPLPERNFQRRTRASGNPDHFLVHQPRNEIEPVWTEAYVIASIALVKRRI